jgi:hypothetical protein
MTNQQFWLWLNNNLMQAGMNVEYHQVMAWRLWIGEWVANFLTAGFFILTIVCVGKKWSKGRPEKVARLIGILSALLAAVLLFTPIASWRSDHRGFQCEWSGIYSQLKDMQTAFLSLRESQALPVYLVDQMRAVDGKIAQVEGQEPQAWPGLLEWCWGNELERTYGRGLRTTHDVEEALKQRGGRPVDQPLRPAPGGTALKSDNPKR